MALNDKQKNTIEEVIVEVMKKKLAEYQPEANHMPFHYRLLGKNRMALYSFIHSINTSFGTSIFEPVAEILAGVWYPEVQKQFVVGKHISKTAQNKITDIINRLTTADAAPDKVAEIDAVRAVCTHGEMAKIRQVRADLMVRDEADTIYLFDLKTAKPNKTDFKSYKRAMLEWAAIHLAQNPNARIKTCIAIPYNPYYPAPYERWTLRGMLDLKEELLVADEFWNFLGGPGAYFDLLDCFESAGIKLRPELDERFAQFY